MNNLLPARIRHRIARNAAFRRVFASEDGKIVLRELAIFCNADAGLYAGTTDETMINVGKREVLLRVRSLIGMNDDDLLKLAREERAEARTDD